MKKLVFVDSDGTLKNNQGIISEYTKETLAKLQSKGIEVIITTGRPRYHALKVKNNSNASRYVISSNGAEVYDSKDDKVIYALYLNNSDIKEIYDICTKNNCRFIMTVNDKEVVTDFVKNENQILLDTELETFLSHNLVKQVFIRADDNDEIKRTYEEVKQMDNVTIVNESPFFQTGIPEAKGVWFSVGHKNSNKGEAIKALCQYLDVSLLDTYGFGNDYNDVKMFETVNHSIVMDNAVSDLKSKAKIIAQSNEDHGVAKLLESLFLE